MHSSFSRTESERNFLLDIEEIVEEEQDVDDPANLHREIDNQSQANGFRS